MAIPIPARTPGYRIGAADAPLQLEIYTDFQCPFSAKAWPLNLQLIQRYAKEQKIASVTVHPFSLPWHRQSIYGWRAALVVAGDNAQRWVEFATVLHANQKNLTNDALKGKTETEIVALLAGMCVAYANSAEATQSNAELKAVSAEQWVKAIEDGDTYNRVKLPFRLGVKRGVWSVPTYFVNGSEATKMGSSSTVADWDQLLQPLMAGAVPLAPGQQALLDAQKAAAAAGAGAGAAAAAAKK